MKRLLLGIGILVFSAGCLPQSSVNLTERSPASYHDGNAGSGGTNGIPAQSQNLKSGPSDTVRLMDRMQLTQFIYELVKPIDTTKADGTPDKTISSDVLLTFKNKFFSDAVNQTMARDRDLGRPCIYGEMTPDAAGNADVNCSTTNGKYTPDVVVPTINSGRELSRISFCERAALYWYPNLNVGSKTVSYYSVDGFKDKVAKAAKVQASALSFSKSNSKFFVTDAQKAYLNTAYQLFYPGEQAPAPVLDALSNVVANTSTTSTVTSDPAWSNVFLAICLSPLWQNL